MTGENMVDEVVFQKGDLKLERTDRGTCEEEITDHGDFHRCRKPAKYAVTTADYGELTRVRYCRAHVWTAVRRWMDRGDSDA